MFSFYISSEEDMGERVWKWKKHEKEEKQKNQKKKKKLKSKEEDTRRPDSLSKTKKTMRKRTRIRK
jgi:hypothetical protein